MKRLLVAGAAAIGGGVVAYQVFRPYVPAKAELRKRVLIARYALRGRPIAYNLHIIGGIEFPAGTHGCAIDNVIKPPSGYMKLQEDQPMSPHLFNQFGRGWRVPGTD